MLRSSLAVLSLLAAFPAAAAAPAAIVVTGSDDCPKSVDLAKAIRTLLPNFAVATDGTVVDRLEVHVADEGNGYRLRIGSNERLLVDPARDCDERAHAAAVIVALIVQPPSLPELPLVPPPPSVPPATVPPPTMSPITPRRQIRRPHLEVEACGRIELAPDRSALTGGGDVRLLVVAEYLSALLGVGALAPFTESFHDVAARITRVPIDLGIRGTLRRWRVELAGALSLVGTVLQVEGVGLAVNNQSVQFDLGMRIAVAFRWWIHPRVALLLGPDLLVSFTPIDLQIRPDGTIGSTPRYWIGGSLGLGLRL